MMMLETRFNSVQSEGPSLRSLSSLEEFSWGLTLLVGMDNVTEKMRAIIGDARRCSNSSQVSPFLLLCIIKEPERDGGKRFHYGTFRWLGSTLETEPLLGINEANLINDLYR